LSGVSVEDNVNFQKLVDRTEGYSGADIANVCREAALMQMRRRLLNNKGNDILSLVNNPEFNQELNAPITMEDFEESLKNISKSVSSVDLEKYVNWTKVFGNV
jgi:katanin p60 ATPase-containing subunit A1